MSGERELNVCMEMVSIKMESASIDNRASYSLYKLSYYLWCELDRQRGKGKKESSLVQKSVSMDVTHSA